jgi:hypothetical protein
MTFSASSISQAIAALSGIHVLKQGSCFYTLNVFWMLETSETKRNSRVPVKKLRKQGNCLDVFNFEQVF